MRHNWLKIDKQSIFEGKDEKGNRYLSQFLSDYQDAFHPDDINAGCKRCLNDYYFKLTKHLEMSKEKNNENSGYVLKKKYEGIPLAFGSRKLVYTHTITDEQAQYLLKNHPKGKGLFQVIPHATESQEDGDGENQAFDDLLKLSREELDLKAEELDIEAKDLKNKKEVANAILDATESQEDA